MEKYDVSFDKAMKDYGHIWDKNHSSDRRKPHPMVGGYVSAILEGHPFKTAENFTESTWVQIRRDCAAFFWTNRDKIGELIWFDAGEAMPHIGRMLWFSRQESDGGFNAFEHDHYAQLHVAARYGMHRVWMVDTPEGLSYVYEDPDAFKFDFEEEEPFEFKFE